ncbi:3-dehydroquinate dehydratase [Sulfurimonas sp. HSL-1716]|uniref:3-dehydroquinate dehydratase n=1 Tax=Hydrocurvibacter sulfurireducens TaxID=3131937 RepID=UPI0031F86007
MNKFKRGLFALILFFYSINPLYAEYLYKDEVIFNPKLTHDVEVMGEELHDKTGIALRLVVLKQLDANQTIVDYEKNLIKNFSEPTILLTFSEVNKKVDILARPKSLYKYFDRRQVLSPTATGLQAFFMAVFFSNSFDDFKENVTNYGGTIIPILAEKAKGAEIVNKYSAALFNGYADIAEQVALSKNVKLDSAVGNSNRYTIEAVKVVFYLFVIYGLYLYLRKKFYMKKNKK